MDELGDKRGNSAGPSMVANEVAPKPSIKVAVTPMNTTELRTNALPEDNENWMLTTTPLGIEIHFPGEGSGE
jgi:hypothetical protein